MLEVILKNSLQTGHQNLHILKISQLTKIYFLTFLVEKNPFITVADAISDLPQIKSGEGSDRMDYPDSKILTKYQSEMRDWEKEYKQRNSPSNL